MEHNDRKKERKFVKLHLWAPHKKKLSTHKKRRPCNNNNLRSILESKIVSHMKWTSQSVGRTKRANESSANNRKRRWRRRRRRPKKKHVEMLPLRLVPIDIRNTLKSIFLQCININHKYSHKFPPSGLLFYVNFRMVLWRPHSEYNHFACVPIPMEQPKCWVSQGEGEGERVCVHDRKEYELRSVNMRSTHVRYARV